jgi:tetratricopeptide (TPR) repeat protein
MIKKFFKIIAVLLLCAGGLIYWKYSSRKTLITPYSYSFNFNAQNALKNELPEANSSKILIVGDRMGQSLSPYTQNIINELGKNYKTLPKIYNWSRPHEGLHRTLFKLKSLKKLPPIIVYHGASSELYEKTFNVNDKSAIDKNFEIFDNEKIISLIITFPWLSKYFYKNMEYFELGAVKEYKNRLPGTLKMAEKEIAFKYFEYEIKELINLVKDSKSNLIFISTPINLEVEPQEVCPQSSSNSTVEYQQEIENSIKEGNFKSAYPKALELSNETFSNAKSYYLLGKASMGLGDLKMAKMAFQKASVFDCANWRGNAVYNAIMKTQAEKSQIPFIDFDLLMSSSLSNEGLFIDEIFPQHLFYKNIIDELIENLKKIINLNE